MINNSLQKNLIIHVIDSDQGGGAEKIANDLFESKILKNDFDSILYLLFKKKNYFHLFLKILKLILLVIKKKFVYKKIIFHAHLTKAIYFSILFKFLGCKVIITEHNTWNNRRNFKFLSYVEKLIYNNSNYVLSVSKAVNENLIKWLNLNDKSKEKYQVIYNGIRTNDFIEKKNINKSNYNNIKFLIVGSLTNQKGIDIAINLLAKLKLTKWELHIAGEGPEMKKLIQLVDKLNLNNKIFFHGFVKEIDYFYKESDILLITSRWEGFGLVALEALNSGMLIIYSKVPGLDEILIDCETAFPFDILNQEKFQDTLASALSFLNNNNISMISWTHAQKYSTKKMIENYQSIYKRLII